MGKFPISKSGYGQKQGFQKTHFLSLSLKKCLNKAWTPRSSGRQTERATCCNRKFSSVALNLERLLRVRLWYTTDQNTDLLNHPSILKLTLGSTRYVVTKRSEKKMSLHSASVIQSSIGSHILLIPIAAYQTRQV